MTNQEASNELSSNEVAAKLESGEFILSDKKGKSKIWEVFSKISKRDGELVRNYVFCRSCKKVLKLYKLKYSNLFKHYCYSDFYIKEKREALREKRKLEANQYCNTSNNNLAKLIANWMVNECRPYELLENANMKAVFQELLKLGSRSRGSLDLNKYLPEPVEVERNVFKIYDQCFERVKTDICAINEQGFGLSSFIKTDQLAKQSYISLTAHYVKNETLTFHLLGFRLLQWENIAHLQILQEIAKILEDFACKLSDRFILVADSSNAFNKTEHRPQIVPCMSQLLINALSNSMDNIPTVLEIIKNCSNLVNFLIEKGQDHIFEGLLENTSHNAWLEIYAKLNAIESNWDKIVELLKKLKEQKNMSSIKLLYLRAVVETLKPFAETFEALEDDNSPTLHLVIVYLHELKKFCDTTHNDMQDFVFIKQLKENLRNYLEKIETEDVTILHKIALFLYPPTKKLIQYNDIEKKFIEDECMRLMKNDNCEVTPKIEAEATPATSTSMSKNKKLFSDFMESETEPLTNELLSQEITFYKSVRNVNNADFNVFHWWQMQKDNFPMLYKLSCTVLATPSTCAAAKRIFSVANNSGRLKFVQLTASAELEKLMFVNSCVASW